MNQKRNRLEIIHDILKAIQEKNNKIKQTHVMYKANLSYQMLEEYLEDLKKKGLVKESNENGKVYSLTEKGFQFLEKYKLITDFVDTFGLG